MDLIIVQWHQWLGRMHKLLRWLLSNSLSIKLWCRDRIVSNNNSTCKIKCLARWVSQFHLNTVLQPSQSSLHILWVVHKACQLEAINIRVKAEHKVQEEVSRKISRWQSEALWMKIAARAPTAIVVFTIQIKVVIYRFWRRGQEWEKWGRLRQCKLSEYVVRKVQMNKMN